jgi:hypothetical protein
MEHNVSSGAEKIAMIKEIYLRDAASLLIKPGLL